MTDRTFKILLVALAARNAADYVLTLRAVYMLGSAQGNPLMAPVLGLGIGSFSVDQAPGRAADLFGNLDSKR